MEKTLMGSWGRAARSNLRRCIRAEFGKHPDLSMLAAGFAVAVVAKIAIAHGPGTGGNSGGSGCANNQPSEIDSRGTPCLTTPVLPTTTLPATILKLHCGEDGIIRSCEDED